MNKELIFRCSATMQTSVSFESYRKMAFVVSKYELELASKILDDFKDITSLNSGKTARVSTHRKSSSTTVVRQSGVRPFLLNATFKSATEKIHRCLALNQSDTRDFQNLYFESQSWLFTERLRNSANKAFILSSLDQHSGIESAGNGRLLFKLSFDAILPYI